MGADGRMLIDLGYNERRIIEALRVAGPLPRNRLAEMTMVTAPTLTRLSTNLLAARLIREAERVRDGGRGHPPQLLELANDGAYALGIALSPDGLEICLIDFLGAVLAEERRPLVDFAPPAVADLARSEIDGLLTRHPGVRTRLLGAGIVLPGDFNLIAPFINPVKEFQAWASLDITAFFAEHLGMPVWHDNDGNAAVLSEAYFGDGRDYSDFALIYLSHGIGGGLMLGRQLYRGAHGNAAEFGGLFPTALPRPSGRDLLAFLESRTIAAERLEAIDLASIGAETLEPWLSRAAAQLTTLTRTLFKIVDPKAIILGGVLPSDIVGALAARISAAELFDARLARRAPAVTVSPLIGRGPCLGAATLPVYNLMAPQDYLGKALKTW